MKFYDKQKVNDLEKAIIKTADFSNFEIEKAISKPELFDTVIARIKSEQSQQKVYKRPVFSFPDNRKIIFASAACLVILAALISAKFFQFKKSNADEYSQAKSARIVSSEIESLPPERIENVPTLKASENSLMMKSKDSAGAKSSSKVDKKRSDSKKSAKTRQIPEQIERTSDRAVKKNVFYALFPNVELETNEDFQIIRTKLSNSSLSLLGVTDLSLGNDSEINAEMLIDNNGRPRAIRFINQ